MTKPSNPSPCDVCPLRGDFACCKSRSKLRLGREDCGEYKFANAYALARVRAFAEGLKESIRNRITANTTDLFCAGRNVGHGNALDEIDRALEEMEK